MAPFVTEELWARLFGAPGGMLIQARWPELPTGTLVDPAAEAEIGWLTRTVGALRAARGELNVPPAARLRLRQHGAQPRTLALLERYSGLIGRLAGLAELELADVPVARQSLQVVVDEVTFHAPVGDVVDLGRERVRFEKEIGRLDAEEAKAAAKLANADFVARAPAEVVEQERERLQEFREQRERLRQALTRIA
jgi:valyl-tRNA synthetase